MNFLDPEKWSDLEALEQEHESEKLNEEVLKQLHERLRPYFLRRTKKEVLKLPPKNEVIVPLSMAPLQREICRSILQGNYDVLRRLNKDTRLSTSLASLKNMLMQLRKCLQHPYLVSPEIEPLGLSEKETHEKLIEASTKLSFLRLLLPQLKARGHRVLLFSQFVIALNVLEDYLKGEGFKYLRLDGSTHQRARQEGIDEFNREGSDVFLYMLTTRAGGAGINLWTADTVISTSISIATIERGLNFFSF
jgi:chromodomain-helicase-DNA-binding protein 4